MLYLTPSEFGQSPKFSFFVMHSGFFPDAVAKVVAVVLRTLGESILNLREWPDTIVVSFPMVPALGIEFRDWSLRSKKWGSVDEGIRKGWCDNLGVKFMRLGCLGYLNWSTKGFYPLSESVEFEQDGCLVGEPISHAIYIS